MKIKMGKRMRAGGRTERRRERRERREGDDWVGHWLGYEWIDSGGGRKRNTRRVEEVGDNNKLWYPSGQRGEFQALVTRVFAGSNPARSSALVRRASQGCFDGALFFCRDCRPSESPSAPLSLHSWSWFGEVG